MGRSKKKTPPAKEHFIGVRITEELYSVIEKDAKSAKISVSEYIRQVLSNYHPKVKYETVFDSTELLKTLGDMGKIGSNLNQIARHLNEGSSLTENMKNDIYRCIQDIKDIRDDVRKQTGEYRYGNT